MQNWKDSHLLSKRAVQAGMNDVKQEKEALSSRSTALETRVLSPTAHAQAVQAPLWTPLSPLILLFSLPL
jgi:hypothetical protein